VNPFEFLDEPYNVKTIVLGLSADKDIVMLACVVLTQCQRVTDASQTDRRTDSSTMAKIGLYIASYASKHCKDGSDSVQRMSECEGN